MLLLIDFSLSIMGHGPAWRQADRSIRHREAHWYWEKPWNRSGRSPSRGRFNRASHHGDGAAGPDTRQGPIRRDAIAP
ncbi:hypothetical protein J4G37_11140 [Microvirga sp. 3-52]|nr:hypothetical protein [Microvirga sp. 3-52]